MNLSELLITASGTATLEAAILGKPMVIIYKCPLFPTGLEECWFTWTISVWSISWRGKGSLRNCFRRMQPPKGLPEEALRILKDPDLRREMTESMMEVRQNLGEPGAVQRAARIVHSMLDEESIVVRGRSMGGRKAPHNRHPSHVAAEELKLRHPLMRSTVMGNQAGGFGSQPLRSWSTLMLHGLICLFTAVSSNSSNPIGTS